MDQVLANAEYSITKQFGIFYIYFTAESCWIVPFILAVTSSAKSTPDSVTSLQLATQSQRPEDGKNKVRLKFI